MGTITLTGIGTEVHALVPDIPTILSGARLLALANRKLIYVQQYTGATIGSNAIAELYQSPIINLTASNVTNSMGLTGGDYSDIKLGDFSTKKGKTSNTDTASDKFAAIGIQELKEIGRKVRFFKSSG